HRSSFTTIALVGARPTVMDSPSTRRKTSVHFEPSRITRYAVIEYRYRRVRSTRRVEKGDCTGAPCPPTHFPDEASRAARGPTCRTTPLNTTYSALGTMFKSSCTEPPL